jgi:hypothetical protein
LIRNISILERKVRQAFLIFFLDFEQKWSCPNWGNNIVWFQIV